MIIMNSNDYEDYLKEVLITQEHCPPETFTTNGVRYVVRKNSHGNNVISFHFDRKYTSGWKLDVSEYTLTRNDMRTLRNFYKNVKLGDKYTGRLFGSGWYVKLRSYAPVNDILTIIDDIHAGSKNGAMILSPPDTISTFSDIYDMREKLGGDIHV
jgi:hypothetical protein